MCHELYLYIYIAILLLPCQLRVIVEQVEYEYFLWNVMNLLFLYTPVGLWFNEINFLLRQCSMNIFKECGRCIYLDLILRFLNVNLILVASYVQVMYSNISAVFLIMLVQHSFNIFEQSLLCCFIYDQVAPLIVR